MGDAGYMARSGEGNGYTVGRAAALVGVSVRTLHHWDDIGLLVPGARSSTGYRLYRAADLARAQQVLVYRELDFPLAVHKGKDTNIFLTLKQHYFPYMTGEYLYPKTHI